MIPLNKLQGSELLPKLKVIEVFDGTIKHQKRAGYNQAVSEINQLDVELDEKEINKIILEHCNKVFKEGSLTIAQALIADQSKIIKIVRVEG